MVTFTTIARKNESHKEIEFADVIVSKTRQFTTKYNVRRDFSF